MRTHFGSCGSMSRTVSLSWTQNDQGVLIIHLWWIWFPLNKVFQIGSSRRFIRVVLSHSSGLCRSSFRSFQTGWNLLVWPSSTRDKYAGVGWFLHHWDKLVFEKKLKELMTHFWLIETIVEPLYILTLWSKRRNWLVRKWRRRIMLRLLLRRLYPRWRLL